MVIPLAVELADEDPHAESIEVARTVETATAPIFLNIERFDISIPLFVILNGNFALGRPAI
ncbi:MAG: hypothetical protein ABF889_01115 [Bifidobacterium sp.]|uniref:Uncharacterized protein n=1 Tax=Bifidobacterium fermentum TaxID=3059035 RepID=A0AB39UIT5_9BIFI